ncbi:MAG: uracil-DNA glycosylase family protein [Chloroflexota bacterium]
MSIDPAQALAGLDKEIRICKRCDLFRDARCAVPGEGPVSAEIMFVGEGPGVNEDKQGRPFVGAAGKFLEELLAAAGLTRAEVYITNVVKHRPPNNRDPLPEELAACGVWLNQQLDIINPRMVVTLGRHSLGTFLPGAMISRSHGVLREKDGRFVYPMYHPAAALHRQALRDTLIDDMRKLGQFLQSPRWMRSADRTPEDETPDQLTLFEI